MANNNHILVPEAREELDRLKASLTNSTDPSETKFEVAGELGIPLGHGDNGDITAREAGKIGGKIGGQMVKELIEIANQEMEDGNVNN